MSRAPVEVVNAREARARIAQAVLGTPNAEDGRLGEVLLRPEQLARSVQLGSLLRAHRGALLADGVGTGKTYIALALARSYDAVTVVAPAALRDMWRGACAHARRAVRFVSAESLSRSTRQEALPGLVIVDEAHWFRNRGTRRYGSLARLCRRAHVLLLSATPVHNRGDDLGALLALFLGERASTLSDAERATFILRHVPAAAADARPCVQPAVWWRPRVPRDLLRCIMAIEPAVPLRDGGVAAALLRVALLRRLASSHAALKESLQRLLGRALLLADELRAGRYPSARELRSCLLAPDHVQLALPGLLAPPLAHDAGTLLATLQRHIATVRAALARVRTLGVVDSQRVAWMRAVLRQHPHARIVAFSQYHATVRALQRGLGALPGVAALSSRGATIASGAVPRAWVLRQFDATAGGRPSRAEAIRLLLATDLLSEGVNLQGASVVVHLDLPWTTARMEQRVGRLARLGSPHRVVHVHGCAPARALERELRAIERLRSKSALARRLLGALGSSSDAILNARRVRTHSAVAHSQSLHEELGRWFAPVSPPSRPGVRVGCVRCAKGMSLALLQEPAGYALIAVTAKGRASDTPACVLRAARLLAGCDAPPDTGRITRLLRVCERALARRRAIAVAGSSSDPARVAIHRAVDQALARTPRHRRAEATHLAIEIRALLACIRSAGDMIALRECVASLSPNHAADTCSWLYALRRALGGILPAPPPQDPPAAAWRVDTVLVGVAAGLKSPRDKHLRS